MQTECLTHVKTNCGNNISFIIHKNKKIKTCYKIFAITDIIENNTNSF